MAACIIAISVLPGRATAESNKNEEAALQFHQLIENISKATGQHRLDMLLQCGRLVESNPGLVDADVISLVVELTKLPGDLPTSSDQLDRDTPQVVTLKTRAVALDLLILIAPTHARDASREMLDSPNPILRQLASNAIERLNPPISMTLSELTPHEFVDVVRMLLNSESAKIRILAARAVQNNQTSLTDESVNEVLQALIRAFDKEQNDAVKYAVVGAIIDLPATSPSRTAFLHDVANNIDLAERLREFARVTLEHERQE